MSKLKIVQEISDFEAIKIELEEKAKKAKEQIKLRGMKNLPNMVGINPSDAKWLKLKALKYILLHDEGHRILKSTLRAPFIHSIRYLFSFFKKKSYSRKEDFFFYGLKNEAAFLKECQKKKSHLVIGFSYCQKPHECPSGRFNDQCVRQETNPICAQCDIFQLSKLAPKESSIVLIPTVHYIGNYFFELKRKEPHREPIFLITACEMTLKMFADFGNMMALKGIGVRLDGRICNTMKAFELSERGIKPGLTLLTNRTFDQIVTLFQKLIT